MWENMFKVNVLGALRIARAFFSLLKPTRGRLIYFGSGHCERNLVAFSACRQAIEGCAQALREEFKPYGINVVTIDSTGVQSESLFRDPIPFSKDSQFKPCTTNFIIPLSSQAQQILRQPTIQCNTQQRCSHRMR